MSQSTPLDEAQIAHLIDRFYDKVSADPLLGAVFNPVIDDWDAHKRLLTSFRCSVALRAGTYRGNPMAMHRPHAMARHISNAGRRCGARRRARCLMPSPRR